MDLDDLHLAVVIGRRGSLSAAAAELGLSLPTLSKAVARLERQAGVRLFERVARGMRPTEPGLAFLARAQPIALAAADLQAAMRDLRQARRGVLRLGVGHGLANRWVTGLARVLADSGVQLDLTGGVTDTLQRAVASGELELAVIGLPAAPTGTLDWLPLFDDPMEVVAPRRHALARSAEELTWDVLAEQRWVVPAPGTATHGEFVDNFNRRGVTAPQLWVASRASQRELALAEALNALALAPRSVREERRVASRFVLMTPTGGWISARQIGVVRRTGAYRSPAGERAVDWLQAAVRQSGDVAG